MIKQNLFRFNRGISTLIGVLILLIFAILIGGFLFWKYKWGKLSELECSLLAQEIEKEIEKANYCEKDEDCIVVTYFGCPLGCYNLINKKEEIKLKKKSEKYNKNCLICLYKCPLPPKEAICFNKKCVPKYKSQITTEKSEYVQGERINATIFNGFSKSITFNPLFGLCGDLFIEKKNLNWNKINTNWPAPCEVMSIELTYGEKYIISWDQKIPGENYPELILASPGKYRIGLNYKTDKENVLVYSNEFIIK
jgi:hypothetical protein